MIPPASVIDFSNSNKILVNDCVGEKPLNSLTRLGKPDDNVLCDLRPFRLPVTLLDHSVLESQHQYNIDVLNSGIVLVLLLILPVLFHKGKRTRISFRNSFGSKCLQKCLHP